ncbi:MAG TPA: GntR family transcriptional regulator [Steroidobacteraceae bacterium]|jgi:DNA-binding GntR family transcriptional regulator
MSQTALKRTCMRDQIREALVERILDGTYPAGTQLKELLLAREFNVSQAPIREALRELEGSGLVTSERFRGTRVRGADFKEMRESYELRAMLEVRSLQLAAPYVPQFIADLERQLKEMDAALKDDDKERYIDHALQFHRRLVESSGNRTFLNVWDSLLWDIRGRIALRRFAETGRSLKPMIAVHRAVITRLKAQDGQGATERVREILDRVTSAFKPE